MRRNRWIILVAVILSALCLLGGCKSKNSGNAKEGDAVNRQPSTDEIVLPSDELETVLPFDELETYEALSQEKSDAEEKPQKPSGGEMVSGSVTPGSSEGESQNPTEDGTLYPFAGVEGAGETQDPPAVGEPSAREPIILPEIELN